MSLFNRVSKEDHDKEVASLRSEIKDRESKMTDLFTQLLLKQLSSHSPQLGQHSLRVANIVKEILESKNRLRPKLTSQSYRAALLHDYGKIEFDKNSAYKNSQLPFDEASEKVRMHPSRGVELITDQASSCVEVLDGISLEGISCHHERFNGTGYPNKVVGSDICLEAKLIGIVDAFDHLTIIEEEHGMPIMKAFDFLAELSGNIYDPVVVRLLKSYVVKHTTIADRTDVGGSTLAVETGLNEYVRQAQTVIKDNLELNEAYRRITFGTIDNNKQDQIVNYLTKELSQRLTLHERCCRNIILKLCKLPLIEDIKREDIDVDDHSFNALIEDYELQKQAVEKQAVGSRHHLEIMLPITNMDKIKGLQIVAFKPQRSYDTNYVFADLWYPLPVDDENVWLWR